MRSLGRPTAYDAGGQGVSDLTEYVGPPSRKALCSVSCFFQGAQWNRFSTPLVSALRGCFLPTAGRGGGVKRWEEGGEWKEVIMEDQEGDI